MQEEIVLEVDTFEQIGGDDIKQYEFVDVDDDHDVKNKCVDVNDDVYDVDYNDDDVEPETDDEDEDDDDVDDDDRASERDLRMTDVAEHIRKEATNLVDHVLAESINIISGQQERQQEQESEQQNGFELSMQDYNSESENYAITCDDVGGLEVVKSPTIESMSGRSFDDNISFTDEHFQAPPYAQVTATTTTATTVHVQQQQQQQLSHQLSQQSQSVMQDATPTDALSSTKTITTTTATTTVTTNTNITAPSGVDGAGDLPMTALKGTVDASKLVEDASVTKIRRIEHKFHKLTASVADLEAEAAHFDEHFDATEHDDEISNLQGEFSKISWDDSVSPTSNTLGDMGQNTPDNDIQDIATETGGDFSKSTDSTPVPPMTGAVAAAAAGAQDMPTPKPRAAIASSPTHETDDSYITSLKEELLADTEDILAPIPKPRSQMKPSDSFKNLAALAEHSDSVSLRSLDITDELSKTEEPSTEISIRSQAQRDLPITTTTTATTTNTTTTSDQTESLEPTSEISVDDVDTEKSELLDENATSFYIGESSRNVIIKTTPTKPNSQLSFDEQQQAQIEAKDIPMMKEVSVDSDESSDVFKEYVTMKADSATTDSKIVRQGSETRNDLLEEESRDKIESIPASAEASMVEGDAKIALQLEKSELELLEKEIPVGKSKVVHSPQQLLYFPTQSIDEAMVAKTLDEVEKSLDAAKIELRLVIKDGETIKESPSEFEFRSIPQAFFSGEMKIPHTTKDEQENEMIVQESEDISSFIGILEPVDSKTSEIAKQCDELFENPLKESLNREAIMTHYALDDFNDPQREGRDDHGSLGFGSAGTAEDYSSMEEHAAKEEHASLGFISTETAEDFSSMEDYYQEKLATATLLTEDDKSKDSKLPSQVGTFDEINSEQTMKPFDAIVHHVKAGSAAEATNRWSVTEVDHSSSSESNYKSFEKTVSRPLSSDMDNLLTQANSSDYQTAFDVSSVCREATEYVSAASTFESSSGKTISSHESMKSLDSQSDTSALLGSIDVSELSETLVASSTEPDAFEAEEMAHLRDLGADDDDSEENFQPEETNYPIGEDQMQQQSHMKRSQEMIFKPKIEDVETEIKKVETVQVEEFPKPKEVEKTWGLAYPLEEGGIDILKDVERVDDILLYHGDIRRSIDETKLASSLDEGSVLSVSMSSTSNIDTVVENFDDMIGSAGSSSLTGIEGFTFPHDEPASSYPEETFAMEMESKEHSPQDSAATTPSGESRKRHKRSESTSISGDMVKNLADKDCPSFGEGKESGSESDTDPYESEYARQFRSPKERKSKKKKQVAAEMDHSFEPEKRPFTPSQLVAEVIVEDSLTEELEAEAAMIEERRPSQNMQDYSNIPDITVTEDITQSHEEKEDEDIFFEKSLYKVKTQEELHKAADAPLHQKPSAESNEEDFQRMVQEQYKQKLAEIQRAQVGDTDYDDNKSPDSPDSFEMVEQPDITDEFVIIEEVAKEAGEVDMGGRSIKIQPTKYESKHDEEVEKIIIKSAPADPKLGSQIYRDDLNFEFEESPPTAGSSSEQQDESDSGDMATANKRWVEMQLTDSQLRYPYDMGGGVLEDIKEEDAEFEVGSSRISSFKDSFSSTPEYDVLAARRYYARGEHDDISMSSLQEFESLEQAISLENRNKTHQGSTDSSNGSFTRRYMVRHSGSGTAQGDDISISSLKDFEGLENACMEAHLIEIKAKEEAAMLSRSDESNKSNGSDKENGATNVVVTKVIRTVTRTEVLPGQQQQSIEALLKQKLEECEAGTKQSTVTITELETEPLDPKARSDAPDSEKESVDSLEINKGLDEMTSSIDSFDISKDATTRSDIDSLEVDKKQPTREESIDSIENEQMDMMSKFVSGGATFGDGLTTTTTTTTTSMDADGHEHTVTHVVTTTTSTSASASTSGAISLEPPLEEMTKDPSVDSLNMCMEQTTSSAGTTATYQTSAGNSQMSGSVTSCASSTLMEDSFPSAAAMTTSGYWGHGENVGEAGSAGASGAIIDVVDVETLSKQRLEQQPQQKH